MLLQSQNVLNISHSSQTRQAISDWPTHCRNSSVYDRPTKYSKFTSSDSHWDKTSAQLVGKWTKIYLRRQTPTPKRSMVKQSASGKHGVSKSTSSKRKSSSDTKTNSPHLSGLSLGGSDVSKKGSSEACVGQESQESSSGNQMAKNTASMEQSKVMTVAERPRNGREDPTNAGRLSPEEYIDYRKKVAVDKVMAVFTQWFEKRLAIISYTMEASDASDENDPTNSEDRDADEKGSGEKRQKRQFSDDSLDDPSGGGDDNGRDGGGNKRAKTDTDPEEVVLACPFYKHDPKACRKDGCKKYWKSIHRLKEHLYRVHLVPKHKCPRCNIRFDNDRELQTHLRADEPCKKSKAATEEGIDQDTERKLRERKKHNCGQTETQRWKEIYLLLFPGVDQNAIPSPYPDPNQDFSNAGKAKERKKNFERVEKHIRNELPKLVKRHVERRFETVATEILGSLDDIIRCSIAELFKILKEHGMPQEGESSTASPSAVSREPTPALAIEEPRSLPLGQASELVMDINTEFLSFIYNYNDWEDDAVEWTSLDSGCGSMSSAGTAFQ